MGIPRRWRFALVLAAAAALLTVALPAPASTDNGKSNAPTVRFATFNASLTRNFAPGVPNSLVADLSTTADTQAQAVAEIIQRTRPDVLLVNEMDFDTLGPGGGYVLASGHCLQAEVPPENAVAMFEAALEMGSYPLG